MKNLAEIFGFEFLAISMYQINIDLTAVSAEIFEKVCSLKGKRAKNNIGGIIDHIAEILYLLLSEHRCNSKKKPLENLNIHIIFMVVRTVFG